MQVRAGQGQADRIGAHGQDQLVIGDGLAIVQHDMLGGGLDRLHPVAEMRLYAIAVVPFLTVGDDLVERLLTGQHRRELDAVIGGARFGANNGNIEPLVVALEDFLDDTATGHAGAYDDDPLFLTGHTRTL